MSFYPVPEPPAEPQEALPLRRCTRCGGEIYCGPDTLCDGCLEETGGRRGILGYMADNPSELLNFLAEFREESFLGGLFGAFYERYEDEIERRRRE